jgi:hypothetical protein
MRVLLTTTAHVTGNHYKINETQFNEETNKLLTLKPIGDLVWRKGMLSAAVGLFHDGSQSTGHTKARFYPT